MDNNQDTKLIGFFEEGDLGSSICATTVNAQNIETTVCRYESQYLAQYLFFVYLAIVVFLSVKVFYTFYAIGTDWCRRSKRN